MELPPAVIDIDTEESWPEAAVCKLREAASALDEYEASVRRHLDTGGGSSNYPTCTARRGLVGELDSIFAECWVIGYHCTRLTEFEVDTLPSIGMQPLGIDFVRSRVDRAVRSGDISEKLAQTLLDQNFVSDANCVRRLNMLWLVFSRYVLRNDLGLTALFGYWGGEALYAAQSNEVRRELAAVGRACIVEVVVPVSWLLYQPIGERMLEYARRDPSEEPHRQGFESPVCQAVPPEMVKRVIVDGSDEFEQLTGRARWPTLDGTL